MLKITELLILENKSQIFGEMIEIWAFKLHHAKLWKLSQDNIFPIAAGAERQEDSSFPADGHQSIINRMNEQKANKLE